MLKTYQLTEIMTYKVKRLVSASSPEKAYEALENETPPKIENAAGVWEFQYSDIESDIQEMDF